MSSRRAENRHTARLNSILAKLGLVCERTREPTSPEVVEEEKRVEEIAGVEEEEEVVVEEHQPEQMFVIEEMVQEEQPTIFPTPSLRRFISDSQRDIEAHNRIKVLPKKFPTDINPSLIPKIRSTGPRVYIDVLGQLTGCTDYKRNMAEFWFLDTLANLLRRAQEDKLDRPSQAVLILWFCEWMKEMQQFDAASRMRMIRRWKENMINAVRFVARENYLPTPSAAGVDYESDANRAAAQDSDPEPPPPPPESKFIVFEDPVYECSVADLIKISHYLYDLFSTDYQYRLVRSVFTFGPEYHLINGPFQIENPKKGYVPLKPKPRKETRKVEKEKGKGKIVIPDTEEYIRLMELKHRELELLWEQEFDESEEYNKRHSILPLNMGIVDDLFTLYFPPTSEDEIVEAAPPPPLPNPKDKKKK